MRLRVATFNVENLDEKTKGVSLEARIAVLRPQLLALRADVICLQECSAHAAHHGIHELRALDRLVEGTPYASFERATTKGAAGGPSDKHNLVVLSRFPIASASQHWHDLVAPPVVRLTTTPSPRDERVHWDRPVLEVAIACPDDGRVTIFDAHLRAPLAAAIEGQKLSSLSWRTTEGWAEGYYVAAMKRAGQSLELRRRIDRIFDEDRDARILVAGDLNADVIATALRILRADIEDTGNPALEPRSLVALEEHLPEERRFTVLHRGRKQMLDHLLASRALARGFRSIEVLNEDLEDEYELGVRGIEAVGSLHAPLVVELEI
jgi:endonuclease/exonuclease/phosphatase family metal-dependent hydrolase